MKRNLLLICSVFLLTGLISCEPTPEEKGHITESLAAAEEWLILIDKGDYSQSWEIASSMFKNGMSREEWVTTLNGLLPGLGTVDKRDVISSNYTTKLPGTPKGQYVVIRYKTIFGKHGEAIETAVFTQDDGKWRAAGYFIQ